MRFPNERLRESASRNSPLKRATLSQRRPSGKFIPESTLKTGHTFPTASNRKVCPRIQPQSGMHFPNVHFWGKRVPVSNLRMGRTFPMASLRKLHPGIRPQSGTQFPVEPCLGNSVPFASKNGRPGCLSELPVLCVMLRHLASYVIPDHVVAIGENVVTAGRHGR